MGNPSSARKRRFIAGVSVRFVFRSDDDETDDEQGHQKCQKQHHSNRHLSASFRVVNGLLHAWVNWSLGMGVARIARPLNFSEPVLVHFYDLDHFHAEFEFFHFLN